MNLETATYSSSSNSDNKNNERDSSLLTLPHFFPYSSAELFQSCRFWPKSTTTNENSNVSDDVDFLKSVVTPPRTTTLRFVLPLSSSCSSSLPDRRERNDNDNNNNHDDDDALQGKENKLSSSTTLRLSLLSNHIKQFQALLQKTPKNNLNIQYFEDAFPEVLFIAPRPQQQSIDSTFPDALTASPTPTSTQQQKPLYIIVDAGCGEAVLRGADVMAPGILASNRSFEKGEVANLVCSMISKNPSGNVSIRDKPAPLVGSYVEDFFYLKENTVIVARDCQVLMSRVDCFNGKPRSGLAIKTNGGVYQHPSLNLLNEINEQVLSSSSSDKVNVKITPFLQNVSSLFPAALLIQQLTKDRNSASTTTTNPPLRILDACAAPGGKASHVLSRFATSSSSHAGIRLVCMEKSAPRAKQLKKLLEEHHGVDVVNECVLVVSGDANKILKTGTKEHEAVSKFFGLATTSSANNDTDTNHSNKIFFDAVLLDPPCTGFGLRPRLRTFEVVDAKGVENGADYQRKLLSTAVELTGSGGFISYSTCTTSRQENEENVMFGATRLPLTVLPLKEFLSNESSSSSCSTMLSKALSLGMCRPTMEFIASTCENENENGHDEKNISLKINHSLDLATKMNSTCCVLRFGPADPNQRKTAQPDDELTSVDGVGFFLTMFQKK